MTKKATLLKDMRISEISLVMEPASPGADVLFTKKRDGAVEKADFNPDQPRDERGRWVDAARGRAREAATKLRNHAKALATAVVEHTANIGGAAYERLGAGAVRVAQDTAKAVATTRPRGAQPVVGGGVQFNFEHHLTDGSRLETHVQIRPDHLPAQDHVTRDPTTGKITLERSSTSRRALGLLHSVLLRGGQAPVQPFNGQLYQYTRVSPHDVALETHRVRVAQEKEQYTQREELRQAKDGGAPSLFRGQNENTQREDGVTRRGSDNFPIYEPPRSIDNVPGWARQARVDQPRVDGMEIPAVGVNYRNSGWQSYKVGDYLVPSARPDLQANVHRAYEWALSAPYRMDIAENSYNRDPKSPATSNGRGYWRRPQDIGGKRIIEYVPPGDQDFQQKVEGQYGRFRARERKLAEGTSGQVAPPVQVSAPSATVSSAAAAPSPRPPVSLSSDDVISAEDHFFETRSSLKGADRDLAHKLESASQDIKGVDLSFHEAQTLHNSISRMPRTERSPKLRDLHARLGDYLDTRVAKRRPALLFAA